MNDMQIYAQVAKKPRIGAAEIATNLGLTLATVSADLRVLVDAGDLVKALHIEESGRQWQVYDLSEDFKGSRTYKALVDSMEIAPAAPSPAQPEAAVDHQAKPAAAPPAAPRSEPSKVQLAIDCITKLGAATDDQLRDAMKLGAKAYVGAYLASALKSGRVVRDGDRWTLPKVLDNVERVGNIVIASRDASPIPQAVVDAIAKAPAEDAPAAAQHRCAVWSDGTFELETDGVRVAILSHEQAVAFVTFIERMGAA